MCSNPKFWVRGVRAGSHIVHADGVLAWRIAITTSPLQHILNLMPMLGNSQTDTRVILEEVVRLVQCFRFIFWGSNLLIPILCKA